MWMWVTRSSPLKGRTIIDLVFMQTYSNHGALQFLVSEVGYLQNSVSK